jgi:hypothetical protein
MRKVIIGQFDVTASDSDADLLAHARRTAQTQYHPTSTYAIRSVVDSELKVLGLQTPAGSGRLRDAHSGTRNETPTLRQS